MDGSREPAPETAMPKVLYAGPLNAGGTCFSRLKGLEQERVQVVPFDTHPVFSNLRPLQRRLEHNMFFGPVFGKLNASLLDSCMRALPDVVWIDKGFWVWPGTLKELRRRRVFLVQHNTDSLWPGNWRFRWSYALSRLSLPHYDLYFTSNKSDHARISGSPGLPACELTYLGYDPDRFNAGPVAAESPKSGTPSLLYVGHREPRTERYIRAVVRAGLPVTVHGSDWEKAARDPLLRQAVKPAMLNDDAYVAALRSAQVGLGFVSEWNGNETAGRSFEIPACGTFFLGMRTPEHQRLYQEGEEADFFSSPDELVKKARYYLENPVVREKMALAGCKRCEASEHTWQMLMQKDWRKMLPYFNRANPLPGPAKAYAAELPE